MGSPRSNSVTSRGKKTGGQGLEPRLTDPESAVLPLDDPPVVKIDYKGQANDVKQAWLFLIYTIPSG